MARREEVVAHEAIRQNVDAGKLRHAPKQFDEARLLLVIQEERAVNRRGGKTPSSRRPSRSETSRPAADRPTLQNQSLPRQFLALFQTISPFSEAYDRDSGDRPPPDSFIHLA